MLSMMERRAEAKLMIERVRRMIGNPSRWTQGVSARTEQNRPISEYSDRAFCWCLTGALNRVALEWKMSSEPARRHLSQALSGRSIVHFNDTHTHKEVLALLDEVHTSL